MKIQLTKEIKLEILQAISDGVLDTYKSSALMQELNPVYKEFRNLMNDISERNKSCSMK
jgi:hypothetical protein